jgi:hypothetical protein
MIDGGEMSAHAGKFRLGRHVEGLKQRLSDGSHNDWVNKLMRAETLTMPPAIGAPTWPWAF